MLDLLRSLIRSFISSLKTRHALALENLALRQQLACLKRQVKRPRISTTERFFWVWLRRLWSCWQDVLFFVQPETVIRWNRQGFKKFWTWKSRRRGPGRPPVDPEVKKLVQKISTANPRWGAPRVHGELLKLGIAISQRAVSRLMPKRRKPPSQTWRTFLENHKDLVSIDFFTVPTATFGVLFGLLILRHDRRRVVHFNVTKHPTEQWTAQQIVEAFPWDTAPRYQLRDRDSIFGGGFRKRVRGMGIKEVLIAYRSPWQSPYVERLIGSVRRECLNHVIVLGEKHLRGILGDYLENYYHRARTHLSLDKDCPEPRLVQGPEMGEVVEFPEVGGLHHRYERRAA